MDRAQASGTHYLAQQCVQIDSPDLAGIDKALLSTLSEFRVSMLEWTLRTRP